MPIAVLESPATCHVVYVFVMGDRRWVELPAAMTSRPGSFIAEGVWTKCNPPTQHPIVTAMTRLIRRQ